MKLFRALAILMALIAAPVISWSADPSSREIKEDGFEVPKKGPLVSELREDLSDEIPGAETVIRIYEDMAGNRVKESMINGSVFQIEVTPFHGLTYILLDSDGDGRFETKFYGQEPKFVVPQWVIFRF